MPTAASVSEATVEARAQKQKQNVSRCNTISLPAAQPLT